MSFGSTCAVSGCFNNSKKRKSFQEGICVDHQKTRNECPCTPPYALHSIPAKDERKHAWLAALKLKSPPKRVYVCSFHFVDKNPTELHPDPELYLGHDRPDQNNPKQVQDADESDGEFIEFVLNALLVCFVYSNYLLVYLN